MFPWWRWAIVACCRSRAWLVAENLCLRQQLVLRRQQLRPRLSDSDRRFWILASRWFPGWRNILVVVSAATVLRRHRRGWKAYWRRRSRRGREAGRRPIARELKAYIRPGQLSANFRPSQLRLGEMPSTFDDEDLGAGLEICRAPQFINDGWTSSFDRSPAACIRQRSYLPHDLAVIRQLVVSCHARGRAGRLEPRSWAPPRSRIKP
jgi:hypothetical protein